jgi:L-alanine-DL-glutamate epimerase-like enolase superfamily enzyme
MAGRVAALPGFVSRLAVGIVDVALWDLEGRARGVSLTRLLGAEPAAVTVCASGVDLDLELPALLAQVDEWREAGYGAVKIKVGRERLAEDVDRLEAVRGRLADGMMLMVDANEAWDLAEARRRTKAFEHIGLALLEDPMGVAEVEAYRELTAGSATPIGVGESVTTAAGLQRLVDRDAVHILRVDPTRVGGITEWERAARAAAAKDIAVFPHWGDDLALQLASAATNCDMCERVPDLSLAASGVIVNSYAPEAGRAVPADAPGHGVEFSARALDDHRKL